ncbi:MAG: hypothetical protein COW48_06375 [Hydrogenophilales bacterium CG17_big_fil_post_rev_8_21_14_2_50_63_12]|nr:MAG: hypothetical protein COW48_06375 [Hydrogenophilales bacterium CG17_big_fil_post_rev_8_21_14_2_50_63_12]PIX97281.1 MAG: hypothetical protein COZ24_06155 [Hydrogenophilales bacterium CG_4_10_14_3_um_filter_63_21]PJB03474.1 MAG: hypothetical protein CO126_06610 [Hydrogenophilales bacterium CG_4_9_14_3_um_filter_63_34]
MDMQIDLFVTSLQAFWGQIAIFLPKFLAAVVLLLAGWLLARLLRAGVRRGLEALGFGRMAERSGLEALLRQGGVEVSLAGLIAGVVFWLVWLVVAVSAANSLGLDAVAGLAHRVVLFLPNVVVAILVLVVGTLFARFLNRLLFSWLNGIKAPAALTVSTVTEYAIQVFALFIALEQLEIGTRLLTAAFAIAFGGLVFALALAFGLGGREWAAERIKDWSGKH